MATKVGFNQWTANNGKFTLITTVLVLFVTLFLSPVIFAIPAKFLSPDSKSFLMLTVNAFAGFLKGVDKVVGIDTDSLTDKPAIDGNDTNTTT
jgi:hypothetical protein